MKKLSLLVKEKIEPALLVFSENIYLSAIRSGLVSVTPLTIIGGMFVIISFFPFPGWNKLIAPLLPLLKIPVSATFGLLSVFVCFSISHELARKFNMESLSASLTAVLIFLMIHLSLDSHTGIPELSIESLGASGLFTAIIIAVLSVRVQKIFYDCNIVIRLPKNVPAAVYESFQALIPLLFLIAALWTLRFLLGVDISTCVQKLFQPLAVALNTLPGIMLYAFAVTLLWSVGINGDNAMDAVVAPVFLQYLALNTEAMANGQPLPCTTALGFFSVFANVGGTGATLALALLLLNSKNAVFRQVSRLSMPTQFFQINEPIFFGLPIVMNPVFMVPYILSSLTLTAATWLLMTWGLIGRPCVNIPWTTPPIISHYLVTGGDWRACIWGVISIVTAMLIYYPFARLAERKAQSQEAENAGQA
jgi:PTS system cellobiose-specific IIC component